MPKTRTDLAADRVLSKDPLDYIIYIEQDAFKKLNGLLCNV